MLKPRPGPAGRVVGSLSELPEARRLSSQEIIGRQLVCVVIRSISARESAGPRRPYSARVNADSDRAAAQLDEAFQSVADAMRSAGPDMVDQARPASQGQFDHGPCNVADVDEVAPGIQIADGQVERILAGLESRLANRPSAWLAGVPGPIGLKTRATITSTGDRIPTTRTFVASHLLRP